MRNFLKIQAATMGMALAFAGGASAQFTSGSTGADGAYNPTVSGDFDPAALGLNAAGDNIFNFTTINIPANVTIRLRATKVRNLPVVWLATGNVTIAGTLNLDGDSGYQLDSSNPTQLVLTRRPAEPGAGGYYGGLGARGGVAPDAGSGPGGGIAGIVGSTNATCSGGGGSFINAGSTLGINSTPGSTYGSTFLVPLYGGSGGGGGWATTATALGGGGGAGGGAIRIVSTTQISIAGTINARGGDWAGVTNSGSTSCPGGYGAGGAIHLIAPAISGSGNLRTYSGINAFGCNVTVNSGFTRFNVTTYTFSGLINSNPNCAGTGTSGINAASNSTNYVFVGPLYNVPVNATLAQPSLVISQVNNVAVANPPGGQYLTPDVQINANTAVTVTLTGANIPLGTVPTLRLSPEGSADLLLTCSALTGTLAASTSNCSATFPFSITIAAARATW